MSTRALRQVHAVAGALVDTLSINGANQVFRVVSSKRFKENFRPIEALSPQLHALNPVMFDYKAENGGTKDYIGFVAEEVAQIFPSRQPSISSGL